METRQEVVGHAKISLTLLGYSSPEEAHKAALEYTHQFAGHPWEDCVESKWNKLGMSEYYVEFAVRVYALPR